MFGSTVFERVYEGHFKYDVIEGNLYRHHKG